MSLKYSFFIEKYTKKLSQSDLQGLSRATYISISARYVRRGNKPNIQTGTGGLRSEAIFSVHDNPCRALLYWPPNYDPMRPQDRRLPIARSSRRRTLSKLHVGDDV